MEFPFFNNYWNHPSHHWAGAETPAMNPHHWTGVETPEMNRQTRYPFPREPRRRMDVETPVVNRQTRSPFPESPQTGMEIPTVKSQARPQLPKAASKVVDIPVRFVGSVRSETMRTTAAVKIQKVFRGLLVRKSVKKIAGIGKEVDDIEKRVSEKETILNLRRDAKERLKVNEMLMALLFRLDSIRGVDSGVRDLRKSVIKKAIMLQERVDAIVTGDTEMVETEETEQMQEQEENCGDDSLEAIAEVVDQAVEIKGSENVADVDMKLAADSLEPIAEVVDKTLEVKGPVNAVDENSEHHNAGDHEPVVEEAGDQASELQHASVEYTQDKFYTVSEAKDETLKEEEEEDLMDIQQHPELIEGENQNENFSPGVVEGGREKVEGENGYSNRDLMEIMIKGNERLTGLVAELCERQTSQSRLLSSLLQRVENLEKAFRCEKSKRKKKRNSNINK